MPTRTPPVFSASASSLSGNCPDLDVPEGKVFGRLRGIQCDPHSRALAGNEKVEFVETNEKFLYERLAGAETGRRFRCVSDLDAGFDRTIETNADHDIVFGRNVEV